MNTFTVNNKTYPAKELSFNVMCEFEDRGIQIESMEGKPLKLAREYLAICGDMTSEKAGAEIEAHVVNGGDISTLYDAMSEAMEQSGFFRALAETQPEEPETVEPAQKASGKTKK